MTDIARVAEDLRARYGALLTPSLPVGDPDGAVCAAIDEAAERLRGTRVVDQLPLFSSASTGLPRPEHPGRGSARWPAIPVPTPTEPQIRPAPRESSSVVHGA